jgi:hypothetical protein
MVGSAEGPDALFINPAGLSGLVRPQAALYGRLGWVNTFEGAGALVLPISPGVGIGLAGQFLDYGRFQGRDSLGSLAPDYGAHQVIARTGFGFEPFPEVSLGLSLNGGFQSLAEASFSYLACDMGLMVKFSKVFQAGFAYVGQTLVGTQEPSASTFHLGCAHRTPLDRSVDLLMAFAGAIRTDRVADVRFGAELTYLSKYSFRIGYLSPMGPTGFEGLSSLSFGLEATLGDLRLDYSFLPYGQAGDSHRLDLAFSFEGARGETSPRDPSSGLGRGPASNDRVGNGKAVVPDPLKKGDPASHSGESSQGPGVGLLGAPPKPVETLEPKESLTLHFALAPDVLAQGEAMAAKGKLNEAIELFQEAVRQNSQNAQAWWALGNAYVRAGRKVQAIQALERVLTLKPENLALKAWLDRYKRLP